MRKSLAVALTIILGVTPISAMAKTQVASPTSTEEWLGLTKSSEVYTVHWFDQGKVTVDYERGWIHAMATSMTASDSRRRLKEIIGSSRLDVEDWQDVSSNGLESSDLDKEIRNVPVIVEKFEGVYVATQTFYLMHQHLDLREERYKTSIEEAALLNDVNPDFLVEFVRTASLFNPRLQADKHRYGLMWVSPSRFGNEAKRETGRGHKKLTFAELYDPVINAELGAWYFGRLMKRYEYIEDKKTRHFYAMAAYLYPGNLRDLDRTLKPEATTKTNGLIFKMLPLPEEIGRVSKAMLKRMKRHAWN